MKINGYDVEDGIVKAVFITDLTRDLKMTRFEKRPHGEWIDHSDEGYVECPFCRSATNCEDNIDDLHYCFSCGASMVKECEAG